MRHGPDSERHPFRSQPEDFKLPVIGATPECSQLVLWMGKQKAHKMFDSELPICWHQSRNFQPSHRGLGVGERGVVVSPTPKVVPLMDALLICPPLVLKNLCFLSFWV